MTGWNDDDNNDDDDDDPISTLFMIDWQIVLYIKQFLLHVKLLIKTVKKK